MAEFFNVLPPDEARALLLSHLTRPVEAEVMATAEALGRVTAQPVRAPHALPTFRRSTMDGYAVRAADTHGASETLPALLWAVGEVGMGRAAGVTLRPGEAALVHTGGMIPDTADAVVQVEHTQRVVAADSADFPYEIEVLRPVAVGQNVIQVGEDVAAGATVLPGGHRLRPQDLGGLLALGLTTVAVARRPRVVILSTGDEVVPPAARPGPGQVRDINSYTIAAQALSAGGIPQPRGIIADDAAALRAAAESALAESDMVVITAGSSVSARDMTVTVIAGLGAPGVLLHGVATRPGKPTIVGAVAGKPVLGLPGNPVSALVQFDMFGVPAIYHLQGLAGEPPRNRVWARLAANVPSASGREDYVPARLEAAADGPLVVPIFGKSNLIYTLVGADGLIVVPLNRAGLMAGDQVEVRLF
ncbi:MAG: molybdopterin molybdotransferase MoeA [Anaerolineae bacterium]|nr:molybdopterin molybdotransferase MoeA [Anaerolineae bacterium]